MEKEKLEANYQELQSAVSGLCYARKSVIFSYHITFILVIMPNTSGACQGQ
jgi:t-SNARE complex subunit (syntaxin)